MLADAIEARWRTLPYPTPASTKKLVQTYVLGLLLEGQLDQSTLTLKDLEAITKSFTRTLQEIRHPRADYSAQDESRRKPKGESNKKREQRYNYKVSKTSYSFPVTEMAQAITE
jgi:hypothetical protein